MVDQVVKDGEKPVQQVLRLVVPNAGIRTDLAGLRKDLGPHGGNTKGKDGTDAIQDNVFEPEDEYQQLYVGATRDQGVIQPPYNPRQLDYLSQQNNTLGPCIEAMVTNVDGTGYDFVSEDTDEDDAQDDPKVDELEEFFAQPWPDMSFLEMRKILRRDEERTGNAYIEVLRNAQDEVVMFRHIDAKMMRMLRLDDAIPVDKTVNRQGKDITLKVMSRERRYCQLVNGVTLMYFKEFGACRDLHKKTAVWSPQGQRLPAAQRATEVIHFTLIPDAHTPYGIPRWIMQTPSILGSRQAEEFNLEFFKSGGIPPVMVILQGGTLQAKTRQAIENMNAGDASKKNRMQVLEVEPTAGSLDKAGVAKVTVERFGSDRQKDSMFEEYDAKCEERVRRAFRLPPMFLGQSKDYNFATAFASYTVAEAQVFKPEREAFDMVISMKLLPAMGYEGYKMRSKKLVIEDATLKLQGMEVIMAMGDQVEPGDVVKAVNDITGTTLKVSDNAPDLAAKQQQQVQQTMMQHQIGMAQANAGAGAANKGAIKPINPQPKSPTGLPVPGSIRANGGNPGAIKPKQLPGVMGGAGTPVAAPTRKTDMTIPEFAMHAVKALRKRDLIELAWVLPIIGGLDEDSRAQFDAATADLAFVDTTYDPAGLAALASATMDVMAGCGHSH